MQRRLLAVTEGLTELPENQPRKGDQLNIMRVIQTEESARQVLVRRMHDGPASSLSNFILQAEICERFFDSEPQKARDELKALKRSATTTFNEVKSFIYDLRPMMLDDLGVVPTLRRYVESFEDKHDPVVTLNVTGVVGRMEEHVEVTIFRAVQELLNNSRSHGQATEIAIHMDQDEDRISIAVDDNGSGFNVDEAMGKDKTRTTIGLPTLRDRIEMLDGALAIQSSIGQGTKVEFSLPISLQEEIPIA